MTHLNNITTRLGIFWTVFLFALILRIIYLSFGIADYWGDAFHNVFISKLTVENDWVYSDYTGRQVVWLPFYRYLVTLFMFAFDQYDLVIPHVVNIILGSVSCALVAKLVSFAGRKDIGLLSGCGLAVLPWHIAYSNLNTQEMLCGTILLLVVFSYTNKQWFWLAPLAFIGVLTRNEMTPILSVFGLYLIYRKDWKSAGAMLIGGVTGLTLWGFWCYSNTGNFFWWITERSLGSSWNHVFQMQQDRIAGNWYSPILSILQVFPYLIVVLINFKMIKKIKPALQHSVSKNVFTPLFFMLLFDLSLIHI